mmetsp:Transcript_14801/g.22614  ORF Transcript_14801/g.22614 Transcript_14801/m.22614 type:complete len:123 (-) Transcript_14801:202-570(-)
MLTIDEDICIMIPSTTIWNLLLLFGLSLSPCASSEIYDSNERPLGAVTADSMDENHRRLDEASGSGPWPECQGKQFEECKAIILADAPDVYILKNNPNEFHYHRIRIYVTEDGQVAKVPKRG